MHRKFVEAFKLGLQLARLCASIIANNQFDIFHQQHYNQTFVKASELDDTDEWL